MSNFNENFNAIVKELEATLTSLGFEKENEVSEGEKLAVKFNGEKGAVSLEYNESKFMIFTGETTDFTDKRISVSLLDDDASAADIRFIISESKETLNEKFAKKTAVQKKASQKTPHTVSKAAVKNGSFYDANTLASKLCLVFPELRPAYKENLSNYGEFMGEEFFTEYGTEKIIAAIKENNPQTMKKLFQILNEIYEDGTNDTQSLIAVTILGELNNDKILLARCVDYMSETMAPPVIEVNRYLASPAGKKARKQLKNPPAYKPKKEKKPGMFAQVMAQNGGGMPPAM
ncbi:MAG: hypothetical protein IJ349_01420 [Clostridia bacterium]|nr:hypothetical protein [Clostridia bacterium]